MVRPANNARPSAPVDWLAASSSAVAVWTLRRPPRTVAEATSRLAAGLTAAFLFAPSSRLGYFALPPRVVLTVLPSRTATTA